MRALTVILIWLAGFLPGLVAGFYCGVFAAGVYVVLFYAYD